MTVELKGKTAIVTGAASGIGLGIAKALGRRGHEPCACRPAGRRLEAARKDIEALGAKAGRRDGGCVGSVSVADAGRAAEQAFGKLHVAVNNAGVAMHGTRLEDVGAR